MLYRNRSWMRCIVLECASRLILAPRLIDSSFIRYFEQNPFMIDLADKSSTKIIHSSTITTVSIYSMLWVTVRTCAHIKIQQNTTNSALRTLPLSYYFELECSLSIWMISFKLAPPSVWRFWRVTLIWAARTFNICSSSLENPWNIYVEIMSCDV